MTEHDYSRDTFFGAWCELTSLDLTMRERVDLWLSAILIFWFSLTMGIWMVEKSLVFVLQLEANMAINIVKWLFNMIFSLRFN